MTNIRIACLGLAACLFVGVFTSAARADLAGPWPWSKRQQRPWGSGAPPEGWGAFQKAQAEADAARQLEREKTPPPEPPRRTGPFRSCGSGIGTGFAGIGLAWGLMWIGNRFASRVRRNEQGH
ncbi:MAG: hypothetical protein K8U57_02700 [Planctomycetes bacterium]|nr:hypothetical protein [Planctomycetota bacterium]